MEHKKISEFTTGDNVRSCYIVKASELVAFRNKPGSYLKLTLADATGNVTSNIWNNAEIEYAKYPIGTVILISGFVEEYQGKKQLKIDAITYAQEGAYEDSDLMNTGTAAVEKLMTDLFNIVSSIESEPIREVVSLLFYNEDNQDFISDFFEGFAAKQIHHAYKHGLLEHTVNVTKIVMHLREEYYPHLNRSILIAGALLHDIGKTLELTQDTMAAEYTDAGNLMGHISISLMLVMRACDKVQTLSCDAKRQLYHMILSHHGENEYGSPVKPATGEAMLLHSVDKLDASVIGFRDTIQNDKNNFAGSNWSNYNLVYDRKLFIGDVVDM